MIGNALLSTHFHILQSGILETEYIALTNNNYVSLTQAQISLCAKIGYRYYCEYAHLLKKCTEHTCMSAIYYYQESKIKANQCKTIVNLTLHQSLKYWMPAIY